MHKYTQYGFDGAYWEKKEPILWNKVYDLEDYVYFNHSRHVATGLDSSIRLAAIAELAIPFGSQCRRA